MSATAIAVTGRATASARSHSVSSEWSKLAGSRGTWCAYVLLGALTVGLSALVAAGTSTEPAGGFGDDDLMVNSLGGFLAGSSWPS